MNPLQSKAFALKQSGLARAASNVSSGKGSFVNGSAAMSALGQIGSLVSLFGHSSDEDTLLQGDTQDVASAVLKREKRKDQIKDEKIIKSVLSIISMLALL